MRVWKESYSRRAPIGGAAAASAIAHVVVVAAWVVATLPVASLAHDSIANRIFYIPPPDKQVAVAGARETIRYITLAEGLDLGPGPMRIDTHAPIGTGEHSPQAGRKAPDTVSVQTPPGNSDHTDSVFTVLEVDSAVVRSTSSAAPAYPLDLLKQHIEGTVRVRYVVDTTGFADPASIEVIESTNPEFLQSVRDALPYMRFSPAKIGDRKVRQLVEQPFSFHIAPSVDGPVNKTKP